MSDEANGFLDELYIDHSQWLKGLLYSHLGCNETAADLAQDTFLRLLSRDENIRLIQEPRAYLRRIALGMVANHWRRRDIERAYFEALQQQPESSAISAETHYVIIETLQQIDVMLQELPDKVRQAFLLARLDCMRYVDIGEVLGVSERMVKKYMAQAMLHFLRFQEKQDFVG